MASSVMRRGEKSFSSHFLHAAHHFAFSLNLKSPIVRNNQSAQGWGNILLPLQDFQNSNLRMGNRCWSLLKCPCPSMRAYEHQGSMRSPADLNQQPLHSKLAAALEQEPDYQQASEHVQSDSSMHPFPLLWNKTTQFSRNAKGVTFQEKLRTGASPFRNKAGRRS